MNKEYKFLIELTKAYLYNEKTTLKEDINYTALFNYAAAHNLLGVVYCAVNNAVNKNVVPPAVFNQVKEKFFDVIYVSNLQNEIANTAKNALSEANIKFIPFKGIDIKKYFPIPESRIMGDIDILIDEDDVLAAKNAMTKAGFTVKNESGPVWDYEQYNVKIEMHSNLLNDSVDKQEVINHFSNAKNNATFCGCEGEFNNTFQFEYLIAHIAHHFRDYGAGIKLILDLAVMLKYANVDLKKAVSNLEIAGLGKFSKEILSVCFKWYGTGVCFNKNTQKTEDFIVSFGAFGKSHRNNSSVVARKDFETNKHTNPLAIKLRVIFPPYSKLKTMPYIKFIYGKPYLTPIAWIYRIFYNLRHRKKSALNTATGLNDKKTIEQAKQEFDFFKEIGLL